MTPFEATALTAIFVAIFLLFVAGFSENGWRNLSDGMTSGLYGFGFHFLLLLGLSMLSFGGRLGGGTQAVSTLLEASGMVPQLALLLICFIAALLGTIVGPLAIVGAAAVTMGPVLASLGLELTQVVVALFLTAEAIRVGPRPGRPGGGNTPSVSWPHYIAASAVTVGYVFLPASIALPFQ